MSSSISYVNDQGWDVLVRAVNLQVDVSDKLGRTRSHVIVRTHNTRAKTHSARKDPQGHPEVLSKRCRATASCQASDSTAGTTFKQTCATGRLAAPPPGS